MKKFLLLIFIFSLSGCSWYNASIYTSKPHQYVKVREVKILDMPKGIERPQTNPQFEIPQCNARNNTTVSLLPPGSSR